MYVLSKDEVTGGYKFTTTSNITYNLFFDEYPENTLEGFSVFGFSFYPIAGNVPPSRKRGRAICPQVGETICCAIETHCKTHTNIILFFCDDSLWNITAEYRIRLFSIWYHRYNGRDTNLVYYPFKIELDGKITYAAIIYNSLHPEAFHIPQIMSDQFGVTSDQILK